MKTDIQIAQENEMYTIEKIARIAKIDLDFIEMYGKYRAKIDLKLFDKVESSNDGKLILVTAINPTKAGEGKSTTTVGLCDGLAHINKQVIGALREPSLGPIFGMKGGATGGGFAQVVPMDDINLHFNGDMHAITAANNLIAATIDNHLYHGNNLDIDPNRIVFKRAMDMNDRSLREIEIGRPDKRSVIRKDGFNITVASEIMAILCLSSSLEDFKKRVNKVIIGYTTKGEVVTVKDLKIAGAVAMIMKDAIKPNLVQTLEHTPMIIHGGPFANIAHGCNSIIATKLALKLADYVVTEAGFGADLGAQKFMDIKCDVANIKPNAIVLVATVRALKLNGGVLYEDLGVENIEALLKGTENLSKHLENLALYKVPVVVAINRFNSDTHEELKALIEWCKRHGAKAVINESWAKGAQGAIELAEAVVQECEKPSIFKPLLKDVQGIQEKIETIAKTIYGASKVNYTEKASQELNNIIELGYNDLNVCMDKNQYSLSDDPKRLGRPKDFEITIKELRISAGAGFIVALTGDVMTMPGLPKIPAAENMDIDEKGHIVGLF